MHQICNWAKKDIYGFLSLVCRDLSNGLEAIPIPVTNEIDDSPITPNGKFNKFKVANSVNKKI